MEWPAKIGAESGLPETKDLIFLLCSVGDGSWVRPTNGRGSVRVCDRVTSVGGGAGSRGRRKTVFGLINPENRSKI